MTNTPDPVPCRLYVILAREAPTAVVFRRGPSKWVQVIKWDTGTDSFTPGQWFHGRIYENRGDLSSDGKLLICFAQKYNAHTLRDDEYTYSWTAISKLPYLTALALWPCGTSGGGGGLFSSDSEVWLNHWGQGERPHPDHLPKGLKVDTTGSIVDEAELLIRRLTSNGWRHTQQMNAEYTRTTKGFVTHAPGILQKQNPFGKQTLIMTISLSGFTSRDHYSVQSAAGNELLLTGVAWADVDQRGQLVYVRGGKLFAAAFAGEGLEERELADFNGHRPEPLEAPEWAKSW